ncbi:MAG TPA: hypothetical protein VMY42_02565 [Thermoguttaceae bacterium]|nr:hypothetical protein [Thermoguttaceae bacterium]
MADVVYSEENDSPIEKWGEGGSLWARQVLRCDWEDRYDLLLLVGQNGGRDYPHSPGMGCYARGAGIIGFGRQGDAGENKAEYEHALVTVVYSTDSPQGSGPRRWVTEEMVPCTDNRRMEIGQMKWTDASGQRLAPPEAPSYQHGSIDYILTFHYLTSIPIAAHVLNVSNAGPVGAFLYPLVFGTETLRHLAPLVTHTVGLGMTRTYKLQYRWTFRDKTWSKFQDSAGQWDHIYHVKTGAILRPYPTVDFTAMYP